MLNLEIPKLTMKLVPCEQGFDLLLKLPDDSGTGEPVIRVATVYRIVDSNEPVSDGITRTQRYATCLAASFLMLHSLDDVLEYVQPEGWSDDDIGIEQANLWRAALRAYFTAVGAPHGALAMYADTPLPETDNPG